MCSVCTDCRVYYLYYKATMQHRAMQLMSRKMAAAQALEGEFSEDGLAAMAGEDNLQMALAKSLADRIDEADMQRSWTKVPSGPKKSRPTDALKDLTAPTVRTPAPMPALAKLAALTHPQRQAFKRMARRPDAVLTLAEIRCITDTADALVVAGLAERLGNAWRCLVHGEVLKDVLVWFQLSHADSKVHYPLSIVKARRPGGGEHYVRLTNHTALPNAIELLPVAGFPLVNSVPRSADQAEREGWVLTRASDSDRAALQANGFFKPAETSPLDDLPISVQLVASSLNESRHRPVPPAAAAEFPGVLARIAAVDAAFAVTAGATEATPAATGVRSTSFHSGAVQPETVTLKVHRPEPEPDGAFDVPEFTEELLLKMLANLTANGMTLEDLAG